MYYDGSQDFELEEDKLYVDFVFFAWWHVDDSDHLFHESFSLVKAMKRSDRSVVR